MKRACEWSILVLIAGVAAHSHAAISAPVYFRSDAGVAAGARNLPSNIEAPEALRWRVALDSGNSTPILFGGRIFLTTWNSASNQLATVALDQATGRMLWRASITPVRVEQTHEIGSPATATVACDGQRVIAFFGSVGTLCYDLEGRKLWEQPMGPFRDEYGAGSSPIIFDGKVILNQDHDLDSFLVALDLKTGKVLWKTPRPDAFRSYSTPVIWDRDGRPEILAAGALQLTAYDPANGDRRWWVNGLARIVIPVPVASGGTIFMASWAPGGDLGKRLTLPAWNDALARWDGDHDGKLARTEIDDREVLERFFRMDDDQDGKLDPKEWSRQEAAFRKAQNAVLALKPAGTGEQTDRAIAWKYERGVPYVASPVLANGILWMVKDGGIVTKLEAHSGRVVEEERLPTVGSYYASPVVGDDKIYFASESGTLSVLAAEREWRLLASHDFRERIKATPLLDRDCIYLRTEKALYCFQGKRNGKESQQ